MGNENDMKLHGVDDNAEKREERSGFIVYSRCYSFAVVLRRNE